MTWVPGDRLGPYEVTDRIGVGGMGEVYRATDSNLKRSVALKVLPAAVAGDADRLARFQREAEVLAALNHPNIAAVYGLEKGRSDGSSAPPITALVMEFVDGEDLSARIARGAIPPDEALPIARQIAEALEAAHEQGIVHRDLKPQNIKVRADGMVKVLDFGLAKALDQGSGNRNQESGKAVLNSPTITTPAMTAMGMILGTAAYMAPEQARGRPVDRRADIWAFGAVLYEMLTGRRAFEGDDISITLASVLKEEVKWKALPRAMPSSIEGLLRRCLEKDPRRRLQAIGEARIAIEEAIAGGQTAGTIPTTAFHASGLVWKIAAGVLALAVVGLGLVAVRHVLEQPPVSEIVRFHIPSPEGFDAAAPQLSPDGRLVAFRTAKQLWVHSLESSASWPLPGTEGAAGLPLWSPDSRHLAFRVGRKLQKVAVVAGQPQPIADLPEHLGGSWGRDGVIVFGSDRGVMQVPEAGGTPTVLIPRDPSRTDITLAWPKFLADGRQFVYSQRTATASDATVEFYLGSLDRAQAPVRLMDAQGAQAVSGYAPSSDPAVVYLVFALPGALMAQAFDTRNLAIVGEARRIDADLDPEGLPWASVSTTGVLAYQSGRAAGKSQLTWFDRGGKTLGVEWSAGTLQAPYLSRDGKRVAIERRDSGNADIWVLDLSRGTTTRVTTDPGADIRPVLSPDGARVAYARDRIVYQKSTSGAGDEERLGDGETMDWSPDGRFISLMHDLDLWALPLAGDRRPILIAGGKGSVERRGRFSPDGKWVAFESNVSGRYEIYLQSFPPSTDHLQIISVDGGDSSYWRADGRELFFRALDNRIMAVDIKPGPKPEPGVPRALFQLTADIASGRFVVTPDGQRFLVPIEVERERPQIMVTLNWIDPLERRTAMEK